MELGYMWIAIGIGAGLAALGYFIGDGLKNFQNPIAKNIFDSDEDDNPQLIKEKNVHYYLGISKADVEGLLKDYPDIPHMKINNNIYFPKAKLREWMKSEMK